MSAAFLDKFYGYLSFNIASYSIRPENIWNIDETGVALRVGIDGIVHGSAAKRTAFVGGDSNRE